MKKLLYFFGFIAVLSLVLVACNKKQNMTLLSQSNPTLKSSKSNSAGTGYTIQSGEIYYSAGSYYAGTPIQTGYNGFGYNYQAHMFNGWYVNVYLGSDGFPPYTGDSAAYAEKYPSVVNTWYWPYCNTKLSMKWNDAWLSNKDRDGDGKLDRHYGFSSYIGSGAWLTNHMWGTYLNSKGKVCHWNEFTKIVAVPSSATLSNGTWYNADGVEIGVDTWGQFATIQDVYNDPNGGFHGIDARSLDHNGLGGWLY